MTFSYVQKPKLKVVKHTGKTNKHKDQKISRKTTEGGGGGGGKGESL